MASRIHALVALDEGVDSQAIQAMLPDNGGIEVVGIINGLDESWRTMQETATDLLIWRVRAIPTARCTSSTVRSSNNPIGL